MTEHLAISLTPREVAILGAVLRCSNGWQTPQELERFVNVAAEHVRDGWTEDEMQQLEEKLAGAWLDRKTAAAHEVESR